jgi:hypothetical protein
MIKRIIFQRLAIFAIFERNIFFLKINVMVQILQKIAVV